MEKIVLSVIIPVYNSEKTIEKCVRSILDQSFEPIEVVAVDDGSSDNSFGILSGIAKDDHRLKIFRKDNGGVSSSRNFGLFNMSEESNFFTFVDSDDVIENNIYEKALNILNDNPEVGMAIFSHRSMDDNGNVNNHILDQEVVCGDYVRNIIAYDNYPYGGGYVWNRVYRKDGYWSSNPVYFREDIDFYEDKIFLMDLMKLPYKLYTMPDIGYLYFDKERRNNSTKILQYLVGLRELVYSDNLSSESRNRCIINYAGGFSSALNFALEQNDSEMIGILNELLSMEPAEIQQILAVAFQKLSKKPQ